MNAKAAMERLRTFGTWLIGARALRSPYGRNVAILSLGTALAQAIPILISPILTRLYSPEDFGVLALYSASVGLLAVVASGRYELAIMLPDKDEDADALVVFSVLTASVFSIVCLLVVLLLSRELATLSGHPEWRAWLFAVPFGIFLTATYASLNYWLNRHRRYVVMSRNRILQSGSGGALNIAFGLAGLRPFGLILAPLIGQFITTATIAGSFVKHRHKDWSWKGGVRHGLRLARRYRQHPLYLLPSHWVSTAATQIPVLAISAVYGIAAAGFFLMANRIVTLPTTIIANAVGDVYRQEITRRYQKNGQFRSLFVKTMISNAIVAIIPTLALVIFAPQIFLIVFGERWQVSGEFAQLLALAAFFQFVFTPIDKGALVVGANRYIFGWCVLRLALTALLCAFAFQYEFHVMWFVAALSAINFLMYVLDGIVEYILSGPRNGRSITSG